MKSRLRTMTAASTLLAASALQAGHLVTEVIPIGYRSAHEIFPIVRALVPPPGSVSGIYNQLVVKTTPENLQEVKRVLAELDRPPRRLMITMRHGISGNFSQDQKEAFGTVETGDVRASLGPRRGRRGLVISHADDKSKIGIRALSERTHADEEDVQRIQVLEGREAFIQAGQSVPFTHRQVVVHGGVTTVQDNVHYRNVGSGFYVIPRVSGNRVSLAISPERSRFTGSWSGPITIQQAQTTVSGPLGEWIELGGVSAQASRSGTGIAYAEQNQAATRHRLFVKVEVLPQ